MGPLIILLLFVHVICAVFLVGSSIFVWIIVWPASTVTLTDEKLRTRFMSVMGKRYAFWTNISVILLTITGLALIAISHPTYFYNLDQSIRTGWGYVLTIKILSVAVLYGILYGNNLWHGKKIPRLAEAGEFEELKRIRKISHLLSFITVALMIEVVLVAELLAGVFF